MNKIRVQVTADYIYQHLTSSEKEKFEEIVIADVKRNGNEINIEGIAIEKKNYDEKKYQQLLSNERKKGINRNIVEERDFSHLFDIDNDTIRSLCNF